MRYFIAMLILGATWTGSWGQPIEFGPDSNEAWAPIEFEDPVGLTPTVEAAPPVDPRLLYSTPPVNLDPLPPLEVAAEGEKKPEAKEEKKEKKEDKVFDFSGYSRSRYETKQNYDLIYSRAHVEPTRSDDDDNFFLHRLRLFLDYKPSPYFSGRVTLQDAREWGSHHIDHDRLDREDRNGFRNKTDLYEAYVKLKLGNAPLWLQVGRQEMDYGDGRLIGSNRWRNTGKSYDAARLMWHQDNFKLDLIAANVVLVDSNAWDHPDRDDDFLAAYASATDLPHGDQDLYLLYRDNSDLGREIYTFGTLIKDKAGPLDWRFEGAYQWGNSEDRIAPNMAGESLDHKAWAISAELGFSPKDHPCKPRFAVAYDFATGDEDPNDGEDNTFDSHYPRAHSIHGWMDLFSWKNLHDPHLKCSWQPHKKLKLATEWHWFFLDEESSDAWYGSSFRVTRNARGADVSSYVGQELGLRGTYTATEDLEFEFGYGHFFAGQYAEDTAPAGAGGDDADFAYLQVTYKF